MQTDFSDLLTVATAADAFARPPLQREAEMPTLQREAPYGAPLEPSVVPTPLRTAAIAPGSSLNAPAPPPAQTEAYRSPHGETAAAPHHTLLESAARVIESLTGGFVRPPTVAASPARSRDISTEFARVDPGGHDSTVGGLATLPPCLSPATGGVERCATLRRHGPGPGEVPCPRSPQFLLQPRLQFLPLPRQPQPLPLQPCLQPRLEFPLQFCLQLRLQFLQRSWNLCPRRIRLLGRLQTTAGQKPAGHPAVQRRLLRALLPAPPVTVQQCWRRHL
ncbi:hypothetical protein HPB47_022654 [Ixodes persulcatus]|uniref:Uncharacterized protein n=1 Tax=Ixodes persulcatus TaxID=34615 RepID=A0AC60QZJ7_IXOPE|nr:hypothetical protein HPB47_022654 [Ixodes persulcatus]